MVEGMRGPLLIGLGHRRRVGKDTFGRFLCDYLRAFMPKTDVRVAAFADKLKAICHELYGWAGVKGRQWYEDHPEEREVVLPAIGMSPRELWIKFGTNAVRQNVYQDTWVDALLRGAACDVLIVTDVRFPGEAKKIVESGGFLVRLDNPSIPKYSDIADGSMDTWEQWDQVIVNSGTVDDLRAQAFRYAEHLLPLIHGIRFSER